MRKPCCVRKHTIKGAWTMEEDRKLIDYIRIHGEGCWRNLPKAAGLQRCCKSCRLRWTNYLRPDIKRGNFGQDEEDLIIKLHALLGNRWSLIAGRLPGRTDNEVENYWNSHIRRKLISVGIDPNNHRLNQIFPTGNQPSKTDESKLSKTHVDDEQLSDAASCIDNVKSASHHLNLDLTIAFTASPSTVEEKRESTDSTISKDIQNDHTLHLFR